MKTLPLVVIAANEVARNTENLHAWMERAVAAERPEFAHYCLWEVKHAASNVAHYQNVLQRYDALRGINEQRRLRGIDAEPVISEVGTVVRPLVQLAA
jgi:hypothetical protein